MPNFAEYERQGKVDYWRQRFADVHEERSERYTDTIAELLNNQERLSDEEERTEESSEKDAECYSQYAMPLARRSFPQLFAHNVVGVQPMTEPMGLTHALRYAYDGEEDTNPVPVEFRDFIVHMDSGKSNDGVIMDETFFTDSI
jgi:hypothetical protein